MCKTTEAYLNEVLKEQKAHITATAESASFWIAVTDRDLFSCLSLDHQRNLIDTPLENLDPSSLCDLVDKNAFNQYYRMIMDKIDIKLDFIANSRIEVDSRVVVLLSLMRES